MPGPPKTRTPEQRKAYLKEYGRKRAFRTVNIGSTAATWRALKDELGEKSDENFSRLLIQCYLEHLGCKGRKNHLPVTLSGNLGQDISDPHSLLAGSSGQSGDVQHQGNWVPPPNSQTYIQLEGGDRVCIVKTEPLDYEDEYSDGSQPSEIKSESNSEPSDLLENKIVKKIVSYYEKDKTVKIEDSASVEDNGKEKRRSQRMLKIGYRPNYAAVEWDNDNDSDDNDGSAVTDDNDGSGGAGVGMNKEAVKNSVSVKEGSEDEVSSDLSSDRMNSFVQSQLKEQEGSAKSNLGHKQKGVAKSDLGHKQRGIAKSDLGHKQKSVAKSDPGHNLKGVKRKKCQDEKDPDFELTDGEEFNETSEGTANRTKSKIKVKQTKKFASNKKNPLNRDKKKPWITIRLEDHQDKYNVETIESFEQQHRRNNVNEEMFSCLLCNHFRCAAKDIFENHIEQHVNLALECKNCSYVGFCKRDISNHRYLCYGIEKSHICDLCGYGSKSKATFRTHMGKFHQLAQWKCKHCSVFSATRRERMNHVKEAHPSEYRYCISCNKVMADMNQEDYVLHLESCKARQPCEICGQLLKNRHMARHKLLKHHAIRTYHCDVCPYIAKNKTTLRMHLQAHKGEHPYKCDQCSFSCVQAFNLKSHMRTHSGDKPYKCTQCNYAAAWKVQLKDHVKLHDTPGARLCIQCNVLLKNDKVLNTHVNKEHQDTNYYRLTKADNTNSSSSVSQSEQHSDAVLYSASRLLTSSENETNVILSSGNE